MQFDAAGEMLGILRPGVGLWLFSKSAETLLEGGATTAKYAWAGWSTTAPGVSSQWASRWVRKLVPRPRG